MHCAIYGYCYNGFAILWIINFSWQLFTVLPTCFYPTALQGCRVIVFTHGFWLSGQAGTQMTGGWAVFRVGGRSGSWAGAGKSFVWAVSRKTKGVGS